MNALHQHPQVALLFDPCCRALFEAVARTPCSARELAEELGLAPIEVNRALKLLVKARLVATERGGAAARYRIDPHGMASMRKAVDAAWTRRFLAACALAPALPS